MIIRFEISGWEDREAIIVALANNGYKVWVEEEMNHTTMNSYFVVVKLEDKNEKH